MTNMTGSKLLLIPLFLCVGTGPLWAQEPTTLSEEVFTPSMSNVVFTDIGGGFVEVTYQGIFDFSPIGGNTEPYAGTFVYDTSVPPSSIFLSPDPDIEPDRASYDFDLCLAEFNIFGGPVTLLHAGIVITDGEGIFNDGFRIEMIFAFFDSPGIDIPNTSEGLIDIGFTAGAFPGNMFTSIDFPTDIDIFLASSTLPPASVQFATLGDTCFELRNPASEVSFLWGRGHQLQQSRQLGYWRSTGS